MSAGVAAVFSEIDIQYPAWNDDKVPKLMFPHHSATTSMTISSGSV